VSYVLVIDDEKHICWLVEEALTAAGYRVKTAIRWQEGLRMAAGKPPALVLLDLKLPGADGIDLPKEIGRLAPGAPIIIMSGEAGTYADPSRFAGCLVKPFNLEDLRRLVQRTVPFLPERP